MNTFRILTLFTILFFSCNAHSTQVRIDVTGEVIEDPTSPLLASTPVTATLFYKTNTLLASNAGNAGFLAIFQEEIIFYIFSASCRMPVA